MNKWYNHSFGNDYLSVYQHRDHVAANHEVKAMMQWLDLPSGSAVLDLCCGMGRHAVALSQLGFRVIGVDLSEVLLEEARRLVGTSLITFIHGDMREVPLNQEFEAVVNLFTSFGYFDDDADNQQVLTEIYRLLKPGGFFIIDYLNPAYVIAHLVPTSTRQVDHLHIREIRRIDGSFVRKQIIVDQPGQAPRIYDEQVKLYDRETFEHMLACAKLTVDHVHGDYQGNTYDSVDSQRMIFVGHKPRSKDAV